MSLFDPGIRTVVGDLGQKTTYSLKNAERRVGWHQGRSRSTIVDCARSLLEHPPAAAG